MRRATEGMSTLRVFHALPGLGQPFGQQGRPGRHSSATFGQSAYSFPHLTKLTLTKLSPLITTPIVRWLPPLLSLFTTPFSGWACNHYKALQSSLQTTKLGSNAKGKSRGVFAN